MVTTLLVTVGAYAAEQTGPATGDIRLDDPRPRIEHLRKKLRVLDLSNDASSVADVDEVQAEVRRTIVNTLRSLGVLGQAHAQAPDPPEAEVKDRQLIILAKTTDSEQNEQEEREIHRVPSRDRPPRAHEPHGRRTHRDSDVRERDARRRHPQQHPDRDAWHLEMAAEHLDRAGYEGLAREVREELHDRRDRQREHVRWDWHGRPNSPPSRELEERFEKLEEQLDRLVERLAQQRERERAERRREATGEGRVERESRERLETLVRQRRDEARRREEALQRQRQHLEETERHLQRRLEETTKQLERQVEAIHERMGAATGVMERRFGDVRRLAQVAEEKQQQVQRQLKEMARQLMDEIGKREKSDERLAKALADAERAVDEHFRSLQKRLRQQSLEAERQEAEREVRPSRGRRQPRESDDSPPAR